MKLKLAFAVLALCAAAAHAQPAALPAPGDVTALPGVTVTPGLPSKPCKPADRGCYAIVANELKTKYPDVYWKMAQKCMAEEMQYARSQANPLIDGAETVGPPTPGGYGQAGDFNPQNAGERTFCAIAQSDAKPPPKVKK